VVQASGGYGNVTYSWDKNGNRLGRSVTVAGVTQTQGLSYVPGSNRLAAVNDNGVTRTLGTSAAGNVVSDSRGSGTADDLVFSYDLNQRIVAVSRGGSGVLRFVYNGLGQRVAKLTAGGAVLERYHYDGDGHLIAVSGPTGAMLAEYVWLGDLPVAEISGAGSSGGAGVITYIHTDHLGTPQRLTNSSGGLVSTFRWQPFGEMVGSGTGYRLRFPGQLADTETGLHDNGMRTYDPGLGRYLEADPIGLDGGLNRFAYVGGNPLKYVDPTGLIMSDCEDNPSRCGGGTEGAIPVGRGLSVGGRLPQPIMPKPLCDEEQPETGQEKPYAGETPDDKSGDFSKISGGRGAQKKSDGSVWEPDYSQHGGSTWKRWPNRKSWEKGRGRESVRPDGSVR
jgi:RHS repeat-associated protein